MLQQFSYTSGNTDVVILTNCQNMMARIAAIADTIICASAAKLFGDESSRQHTLPVVTISDSFERLVVGV
ncbi:hypothetical protein Plhal703r1_c04g0021451 [Plasmopara halstedii]